MLDHNFGDLAVRTMEETAQPSSIGDSAPRRALHQVTLRIGHNGPRNVLRQFHLMADEPLAAGKQNAVYSQKRRDSARPLSRHSAIRGLMSDFVFLCGLVVRRLVTVRCRRHAGLAVSHPRAPKSKNPDRWPITVLMQDRDTSKAEVFRTDHCLFNRRSVS